MILFTSDYLTTWIERAIGNSASRDIIAVPLAEETAMHRRDFSLIGFFKVYSEQNPRLGHFTYVFKQLIKYIIAARWFIVAGIRE